MESITLTVPVGMADAESIAREALGEQGFGVLTEIDVAATLRAKLGVERRAMKILGACNPQFAHRALELDSSVGVLLPCNVVLEDVGGATRIDIADPRALMPEPEFAELAGEAAAGLQRAADAIGRHAKRP